MSNNINYIGGIVRVLELPTLKLDKNHIPFTKFRVELAQLRNKQVRIILNILAWGNLAEDVVKYYRVHDYILIEGFLSIRKSESKKSDKIEFLQVSLYKIFPVFLFSKY
jgi:single-stranded DNA-binding protein